LRLHLSSSKLEQTETTPHVAPATPQEARISPQTQTHLIRNLRTAIAVAMLTDIMS
jgi:hypothetical protein